MRAVVPLSLAAAAILAAGPIAASASRSAGDPPLMVPWARVGNISLGETQTAVYRAYGAKSFHVVQRWGNNTQGYFRLHNTHVIVTFYGSRVGEIGFTTPYYRTKSSFGVGSTIPLGPCHRTSKTSCEHRWNGFVYNEWNKGKLCQCWVKVGTQRSTLEVSTRNFNKPWFFIYTRHGRATYFYFALKFVD